MNKTQFYLLLAIVSVGLCSCSLSDNERKMVREGNKAYQDSIFDEAEVLYRKALDFNPTSFAANYNIANATYKQENFKGALAKYKRILDSLETKDWKSATNHNLGNSYLHSKEIDKAIAAYKEALRNNPDDMETKYNLVYAMNLKQQQENQQNQNQQNQQNKQQQNQQQKDDKKSQQDNKPKDGDKETKAQPKPQQGEDDKKEENKEKGEDQKDKKEEQKGDKDKGEQEEAKGKEDKQDKGDKDKEQQEQQPQNQEQGKEDENGEKRQIPVGISKEDAENILDAIAVEEKDAQEKVQKDKARKAGKVRKKKNW